MRNKKQELLVITLGFVLIALGGIAHFLNDLLFWYPLGLITIPFISAWTNWVLSQMKSHKKPVPGAT